MATVKDKKILFNNGHQMPVIGLGTGGAPENTRLAVRSALTCGYRSIDTAFFYMCEEEIGEEIHDWVSTGKLAREDIFVTTKLPLFGNRSEEVSTFLKKSLKKLKLEYVDLYLIHHPFGTINMNGLENRLSRGQDGNTVFDHDTDLEAVWKAMEQEVDAGRAKSIGISNFNSVQIDRIMKISRIPPANLQIEVHAYFQQRPIIEHCKKYGITVCAYSPIGAPYTEEGKNQNPRMLDHPIVAEIAKHQNSTPAQILLKFLIQKGLIVIPNSKNPQRIKENIQLNFDLSEKEMSSLDSLDRGSSARIYHFRTEFKGVEHHKEYPFSIPF